MTVLLSFVEYFVDYFVEYFIEYEMRPVVVVRGPVVLLLLYDFLCQGDVSADTFFCYRSVTGTYLLTHFALRCVTGAYLLTHFEPTVSGEVCHGDVSADTFCGN